MRLEWRTGASSTAFPRAFVPYWRATAVSGLGTYVTVFALQALVVLTLRVGHLAMSRRRR